ncbi:MAG: hypothetical protein HZB59_08550 [Ignavibacteriales bacterium]|nr:hypothetical protein [Ignavibacteriales bacterium]
MIMLLILSKSIPDVGITIIFLIALLLILMAINDLIEWLMKKPWKRNRPPAVSIEENQISTDIQENKTENEEDFKRQLATTSN